MTFLLHMDFEPSTGPRTLKETTNDYFAFDVGCCSHLFFTRGVLRLS